MPREGMLNYNHLYYFHVVASEGSVARASDRLGVTQPTISEQVRALERAIGVTLFERTASGLRLTDDGRVAYEHTSIMFRQSERLVHALGHAPSPTPRALRIGMSAGVVRSTSASLLARVFALPDCLPSVRTGEAVELMRELRAGELELVLVETEPPEVTRKGVASLVLERPVLAAVGHPSIDPAPDWDNVALIHYRPSSSFHWDVAGFLQARGLRPRIAAEADDAALLMEAASQGGFVAFVPRSMARDAVAQGRLRVLATLDAGEAAVHALYVDDATSELVRRAVDLLAESARRGVGGPPGALFCLVLTADPELASRARELGKDRQFPLVVVDSIDLFGGIVASVVPTHVVLDRRHGEADAADVLLDGHRRSPKLLAIQGLDDGVAALTRIARDP